MGYRLTPLGRSFTSTLLTLVVVTVSVNAVVLILVPIIRGIGRWVDSAAESKPQVMSQPAPAPAAAVTPKQERPRIIGFPEFPEVKELPKRRENPVDSPGFALTDTSTKSGETKGADVVSTGATAQGRSTAQTGSTARTGDR